MSPGDANLPGPRRSQGRCPRTLRTPNIGYPCISNIRYYIFTILVNLALQILDIPVFLILDIHVFPILDNTVFPILDNPVCPISDNHVFTILDKFVFTKLECYMHIYMYTYNIYPERENTFNRVCQGMNKQTQYSVHVVLHLGNRQIIGIFSERLNLICNQQQAIFDI